MNEVESPSSLAPASKTSAATEVKQADSVSQTGGLRRVLIMAGGTGGHIFPGLAFATYCQEQGVTVEWLGSCHGLEGTMVPEAGYTLHRIAIKGIRGKGLLSILGAPIRILKSMIAAYQIIKAVKPDAVVGMGGFVSGPGGVMAWLLGKPLIIHEQNAKAGITNYLLSYFASHVLQAFPGSFPRTVNVHTVGNPVRAPIAAVAELNYPDLVARKRLRVLVLGGSLGAQALNEILPLVVAAFDPHARPEIWHQTGEKHFAATSAAYQAQGITVEYVRNNPHICYSDETAPAIAARHPARHGLHNRCEDYFVPIPARVTPFIAEMAEAYAWADLVICRAGAITIAELCAAGRGAILIPYPHAVDDHQTLNARFMVEKKAAYCIAQADLQIASLVALLSDLQLHPEKCQALAKCARDLHREEVSARIFNYCKEICH